MNRQSFLHNVVIPVAVSQMGQGGQVNRYDRNITSLYDPFTKNK